MNVSAIHVRPRTLADVLLDLEAARGDYNDAMASSSFRAADQANEAETRLDDLRTEFAQLFVEANGLTVEDFRKAYAEALI